MSDSYCVLAAVHDVQFFALTAILQRSLDRPYVFTFIAEESIPFDPVSCQQSPKQGHAAGSYYSEHKCLPERRIQQQQGFYLEAARIRPSKQERNRKLAKREDTLANELERGWCPKLGAAFHPSSSLKTRDMSVCRTTVAFKHINEAFLVS